MQFWVAQHSALHHLDISWSGRVIQNPQLTTIVEMAKKAEVINLNLYWRTRWPSANTLFLHWGGCRALLVLWQVAHEGKHSSSKDLTHRVSIAGKRQTPFQADVDYETSSLVTVWAVRHNTVSLFWPSWSLPWLPRKPHGGTGSPVAA